MFHQFLTSSQVGYKKFSSLLVSSKRFITMSRSYPIDSVTLDKKASENVNCVNMLKEVVQKFGKIPLPTEANITNYESRSSYNISVDWSHIDFDSIKNVTFRKNYLVTSEKDKESVLTVKDASNGFQDVTKEQATAITRDGKKMAILMDDSKDGKDFPAINFCDQKGKVKSVFPKKLKRHGKIHLNKNYGVFQWSPLGTKLMYVAESYHDPKSYFQEESDRDVSPDSKSEVKAEKNFEEGNKYLYRDEWGEQLEGISHSVICVIDTQCSEYKVRVIEMKGLSLKEGFWLDDDKIGFIGLDEEPRRLGLIFCPIRRSYLFECDLSDPNSKPEIIVGETETVSIYSPRASLDGKVVFLKSAVGGPHFQASDLIMYDSKTKELKTLHKSAPKKPFDIADYTDPCDVGDLFAEQLPKACWSSDNKQVVVEAKIGYRIHLFVCNTMTGSMHRVPLSGQVISVLDYYQDLLIVNEVWPNVGSNLKVGKIVKDESQIKFESISLDESMVNHFEDDIIYQGNIHILSDSCCLSEDPSHKQLVTSIMLSPSKYYKKPHAAIIFPHGGPHSASLANFTRMYLMYVEMGFKVILINYRGSSGVTNEQLTYLCGKIGECDVQDVDECINYYIQANEIDPERISLIGGSHGGFLVTSLIGQYVDRFRACVAINPVVDLVTMWAITDIPDWIAVEGLGEVKGSTHRKPTPECLASLLAHSPIHYVDKIKTPTLLALGRNDKRVPMGPSVNFYHLLKSHGVETKCLVYEDNHSLATKVAHTLDEVMNSTLWILDHISKPKK